MSFSLARRRALMVAALGFMRVRWTGSVSAVATLLATWMDSWRGVGALLAGMTAQGFNVEMKEFPGGWRVNFYPVGIAHSVVAGSAYEPTPWRAVQRAACEALNRLSTEQERTR